MTYHTQYSLHSNWIMEQISPHGLAHSRQVAFLGHDRFTVTLPHTIPSSHGQKMYYGYWVGLHLLCWHNFENNRLPIS